MFNTSINTTPPSLPASNLWPTLHTQFNFNSKLCLNRYKLTHLFKCLPNRFELQFVFHFIKREHQSMISRLWNIIESLFGFRKQERPIPIKRLQKKQRFLVIEDPYEPKPKALATIEPLPKPKNADQLMSIYKIASNFEQVDLTQQEAKQNDELFLNLREIEKVIKEIEEKQKFITSPNEKINNISVMLQKIEQSSKCEEEERTLYRSYVNIVKNTLQVKYTWEKKVDYPDITYESFKEVWNNWKLKQKQNQNKIPGYQYLKYCHLRLLAPNTWLNDEIITEYINQMNLKLGERRGNNFVIFNSLKAVSIFGKGDNKKAEKILGKQNVTRNAILVMAIHKKNHWIFLRMQDSIISIYDSMNGHNMDFPLITKIINFAQYFYDKKVEVEEVTTFPQQNNGNDCGMMMLCGIKDLVRDYTNWSFSQNDILYKRVLFTKEILDHHITGF